MQIFVSGNKHILFCQATNDRLWLKRNPKTILAWHHAFNHVPRKSRLRLQIVVSGIVRSDDEYEQEQNLYSITGLSKVRW